MHAWGWPEQPALRLVERSKSRDDPEAKALACYGLLLEDQGRPRQMLLRFVDGRPISAVTIAFLEWASHEMATQGKRVCVLVWDNASWHISHQVRDWIQQHNRRVKRDGGCRLLVCGLPTKSPWLNPIEPTWLHGKRAVAEADGPLTIPVVIDRVCKYYGCDDLPLIQQKTL
jgi:hypothetical protein